MSRLDDLNIRLMAEGPAVTIYARDNCMAAVGAHGNQGSTGLMTEQGLAYLVWREGQALSRGERRRNPGDSGTGGNDPQIF